MDYSKKKAAGETPRAKMYRELIERLGLSEFVAQSINGEGEVLELRSVLEVYSGKARTTSR